MALNKATTRVSWDFTVLWDLAGDSLEDNGSRSGFCHAIAKNCRPPFQLMCTHAGRATPVVTRQPQQFMCTHAGRETPVVTRQPQHASGQLQQECIAMGAVAT